MKITDYYDLDLLKSDSQEIVLERVGAVLDERTDICKCEQCVLDLIAYVLNNVSPMYRASLVGSLDPHQTKRKQLEAETELAIKSGIIKIMLHPNHDNLPTG